MKTRARYDRRNQLHEETLDSNPGRVGGNGLFSLGKKKKNGET